MMIGTREQQVQGLLLFFFLNRDVVLSGAQFSFSNA